MILRRMDLLYLQYILHCFYSAYQNLLKIFKNIFGLEKIIKKEMFPYPKNCFSDDYIWS